MSRVHKLNALQAGFDVHVQGSDLIVNEELGAFEVSRRHSDVVLLRRVVELCQTPVYETQLRRKRSSSVREQKPQTQQQLWDSSKSSVTAASCHEHTVSARILPPNGKIRECLFFSCFLHFNF